MPSPADDAEAAHVETVLRAARRGTRDPDADLSALLVDVELALTSDASADLHIHLARLLTDAHPD